MLWHRSAASASPGNQRQTYRQSLELPIAVGVTGLPAPVYGTLVNISENGCRLRSLILIDRNRSVEFELKRIGHPPFQLRGKIVSRSNPPQGGGYEYGVTFNGTLQSERDALLKEILELQRREAASRADKHPDELEQSASTARWQRRRSVRTLFAFAVRYRFGNKRSTPAEANDISTGGLRLMCFDRIEIGTEVELRFALPDRVLNIFPVAAARSEITPFGPRKIRIPDHRRPFEEMLVHARVISRFSQLRGREVYGLQFTDIDGYHREEIARFIHAVQLEKLRAQ